MAGAVPEDASIEGLAVNLEGELIRPGDAAYAEARKVFNAMIDKRPALIARCAITDDVVAAVNFAREAGLEIAVRSGGHSAAGTSVCDGGVLIDLSGLKQVDVDPDARIARAGGGVLWGEFDQATQEHGLHTPGGRVTTTGVGGFTTGGGYGWTASKHGLTCDNLVSAEVVTADGRVLTASEQENEDLFWGIRGGSGNFGIVTHFDFRLHELGPVVLAGLALWPVSEAQRVLRAWRDYVQTAPDELSSACVILTGAPEEFVPGHLRMQPCVGMLAMYVGDPEQGAPVMQPLKDLGPDLDLIGPMPYVEFQAMLDPGNQPGFRNYWRGEYMESVSDEAIDTFVEHARAPISPFNQMIMFRLGGGVTRLPDEATAFSHRDSDYLLHPIAMWEDPSDDERQIAAVRRFSDAMAPYTTGGVYLNFMRDQDRVRDAYGAEKFERLVALKDRYDPDNLFRLNQNIEPSREAGEQVPA